MRNLYGRTSMELPRDLGPLVEILVGRLELTPVDVGRDSGVDLEQTRRLWRALGFPPVPDDARIFARADADVLAIVRGLLERHQIEPAAVVQLARLMGRSLARIADAQIDAAGAVLGEPIEALAPFATDLERLVTYVWRRPLLAALLQRARRPASDAPLTIRFADLGGFTALSPGL